MQERGGRRGFVFPIRVTTEERLELERLRRKIGGPEALGPWLLWRAFAGAGNTGARVIPIRIGNTVPGSVIPSRAAREGITVPRRERVILDLCAGSGAWSEPYRLAGYRVIRVTLPRHDVRTWQPPKDGVWGILAAPPCTEFSLAKNGQPRDISKGLETVAACTRIILACRPQWWALENPVGLLGHYLGRPRDVFQPHHFGDPWTKRTAIWGDFQIPARGPYVKPLGGGPPCPICKQSPCSKSDHRAVTPQGFARAFFEANP